MNEVQTVEVNETPFDTIRVFMRFRKEDKTKVMKSKNYQLFQLLSIWGGADKIADNMYSWELPMSLKAYLLDKFSNVENFKLSL